jgi:DNA invertase Pin-like site-specific DNA recombinase
MRVAIYARVSTRDQQVLNQTEQLRQFCQQKGWTVAEEFLDFESGGTADRPEFKRMFVEASRRKFDLLLFWAIDRLSREGTLATLTHLQRLTSYGVKWHSYSEEYINSCGPFADVILSLLASLARQEKIRIGERTRAGISRARSMGKTIGRPKVVPKDETVQNIQRLREGGLTWEQIANETGESRSSCQRVLYRSSIEHLG